MTMAIEMKNWSVRYPEGDTVLKNCSFTLEYGQLAVLSGLSGEGKTTLLSSLGGIIPNAVHADTGGEIFLDGASVAGCRMTEIARKVGYVLQNPDSQIFHSRVADEIAFGCENLNIPADEIETRVSESCRLLDLDKNARTRTLSGGQKQRLAIACILAMGQKILLLDEPLANLDTAGAILLLEVLKGLRHRGYAVLLAEHRLDIVAPYADRFFTLEGGRVTEKSVQNLSPSCTQKIEDTTEARSPQGSLLSASCLACGVKEADILWDVSLDIKGGERIVLLGENGCGKTTLLRLLAGLIKPGAGTITTQIAARSGSRKWFRQVGYVYQEPSYQLFMPTVEEEVCKSATGDWGRRCMEAFDLTPLAGRHPHALSEGQKRRVSIAAVMATAPRIVLLDEPTVGQDSDNLRHMVKALNQIHRETGNAMITVTHDRRCAEALCDRALWIAGGKIFRTGGKELIRLYFGM